MNIFVVEDERWALAELVALLKPYGPEHAVLAFDHGEAALCAARERRPDLVITDINMPGMDGLELIGELHRLDDRIKSMIISVHDQFEYARTGIKYGVSDYLLKPVSKDALYKAVDQALAQLALDRQRRGQWQSSALAQLLLTAAAPDNERLAALARRAYVVALLLLEQSGPEDAPDPLRESPPAWLQGVFGGWAEPTGEAAEPVWIDLDRRQRVALLPLPQGFSSGALASRFAGVHRALASAGRLAHLAYAVNAAEEPLSGTFAALRQAMEARRLFGAPTLIAPSSGPGDAELGDVWDKARLVQHYFSRSELARGRKALRQMTEALRLRQPTRRQLTEFIQDLLVSLKYRQLSAGSAALAHAGGLTADVRPLAGLTGYDELCDWLTDTISALFAARDATKESHPKALVFKLLQLIRSDYAGGVSLRHFAAEHHVSLGYLSRLFKSETGATFSDYLAGYRIGKAAELLRGGGGRLHEIGRLVGYEDPKHFCAVFKKVVGETPNAYAKRHASK